MLGKPTAQAQIKRHPEDFVVSEQLGYEPNSSAQNEHLWLWVEKRGENTAWVAKRLAKHFGISERDVSYAGLKDRQAVTRQWFSLRLADVERVDRFVATDIRILNSLMCGKKLQRGGLAGNRFELLLREVTAPGDILERFGVIAEQGFPNYFGSQRFGHNAGNLLQAERWRQGKSRPRGRNEKGFFLSAQRSWLFNLQVAAACTQVSDQQLEGFLPGKMRFDLPGELKALAEEYTAQFAFLERQGCVMQKRPLFCVPEAAKAEQQGKNIYLTFELPAGSYATSLLRELLLIRV